MPIENHSSNGDVSSPGLDSHYPDIISGEFGADLHRSACRDIFDFLFKIASWMASEILAGCAAYGEAMYPMYTRLDEQTDSSDPDCSQQTAEVIQIKRESESGNPRDIPGRNGRLKF